MRLRSLWRPSAKPRRGTAARLREHKLTTTSDDVVAALGHALCQRIGAPRYDLWFRAKTKFEVDGGRLRVGVPNRFFQDWLQKKLSAGWGRAAGAPAGRGGGGGRRM